MYTVACGAGFAWHDGEEHARSAASTFCSGILHSAWNRVIDEIRARTN